ncbi:ComEC/Rec2 family competence protein [Candidatus Cyanaurora vandensis]|uniref:ComEC/Rec2 family competence protein n=1 Tax=Candidatus Cyanaurora vandensis TaxID=2714958 RepID=UPI00257CB693|nr:ComEC/Rec2 family competence protein [Candidatus Cyanaurora vandensis]
MQGLRFSSVDRQTLFWFWAGACLLGLGLGTVAWGWLGLLGLAGIGGALSRRRPRLPEVQFWLGAAVLMLGLVGYVQLRVPRPSPTDISAWAPQRNAILEAEVVTDPKSGIDQASLLVKPLRLVAPLEAGPQGLLYVRVPQAVSKQLYPGVRLKLIGSLSEPSGAKNPGQFDFQQYLARQGVFATFRAETVEVLSQPQNWLTQLRRTLVQAHITALGSPRGELLSSLVLGSNAVTLDPTIQEQFTRVGLAHLLAASGAQVALIVSNCLLLLGRWAAGARVIGTGLVLLLYLLIAGGSPSILRAGLMGYAVLAALLYNEKALAEPGGMFRPESLKILAGVAVALLLWNPFWAVDLGFQMSFLATLGLILSVGPLTKLMSFLPLFFATNFAVSIAAYGWTLPLQLSVFGQLSPYSLLANFVAVLGIEFLTIGGFLSSLVSLVWLDLTRLMDWPLGWLLTGLLGLVKFFAEAPGSTLYPGVLAGVQTLLLYAVLVALHLPQGRGLALALGGGLLLGPLLIPGPRVELTVLAGGRGAVLTSEGKTFFIGDGREAWLKGTVVAHLRRRGVQQLAAVVPLGETPILPAVPVVQTLGPLVPQTIVRLGNRTFIRVLEPTALILQTSEGRVLYLGERTIAQQQQFLRQFRAELNEVDWVWLDNPFLIAPYLTLPRLKGIFATQPKLSERTQQETQASRHELFWSQERGAITWQGGDRVQTVL